MASEPTNIVNIDGRDRRPWAVVSRETLIKAAIAEISHRGYEHARLVDIAARADMTVGAIYNWFANKAELFAAAIEFALSEQQNANSQYLSTDNVQQRTGLPASHWLMVVASLTPRQGNDKGPTDAQRILLEALRTAWRDDDLQDSIQPQIAVLLQQYETALQKAADAGEIDAALDVRLLARLFLAFPIGLSSLTLAGAPEIEPRSYLAVLSRLTEALRPKPSSNR